MTSAWLRQDALVLVAVDVLKWYFGVLLRCLGKVTRCNATWPDQELLHPRANQTCSVQKKQGYLQPLCVHVDSVCLLTKERLQNESRGAPSNFGFPNTSGLASRPCPQCSHSKCLNQLRSIPRERGRHLSNPPRPPCAWRMLQPIRISVPALRSGAANKNERSADPAVHQSAIHL